MYTLPSELESESLESESLSLPDAREGMEEWYEASDPDPGVNGDGAPLPPG